MAIRIDAVASVCFDRSYIIFGGDCPCLHILTCCESDYLVTEGGDVHWCVRVYFHCGLVSICVVLELSS